MCCLNVVLANSRFRLQTFSSLTNDSDHYDDYGRWDRASAAKLGCSIHQRSRCRGCLLLRRPSFEAKKYHRKSSCDRTEVQCDSFPQADISTTGRIAMSERMMGRSSRDLSENQFSLIGKLFVFDVSAHSSSSMYRPGEYYRILVGSLALLRHLPSILDSNYYTPSKCGCDETLLT